MTLESRTNNHTTINKHKEKSAHNGDLFLCTENRKIELLQMNQMKTIGFGYKTPFISN